MTRPLVGIYASPLREYSNTWKTEEDYPEKNCLRELSRLMGYADGNLFRAHVRVGDRVVIKPNWILDYHPDGEDIYSVITSSAILRAVADLVYEALQGEGAIIIADAPAWDCDIDRLWSITQVHAIREYFHRHHRFEVSVLDLRQIKCLPNHGAVISHKDRVTVPGDPAGYSVINLGQHSAFVGMPHPERIYGADYDREETIRHHNGDRHEYLVSRTILGANVLVHVPKLKTHRKVGITVNVKGMVGVNGNKNWLAHFRIGDPQVGGDECPTTEPLASRWRMRVVRYLIDHLLTKNSGLRERLFETMYSAGKWGFKRWVPPLSIAWGDWYGNDTAWRMPADLARSVIYSDLDGKMRSVPQRRFVSVVDGIVGGEGDGPLNPTPRRAGVLMAGDNLLAVDLVAARLMGFDYHKIKMLPYLLKDTAYPLGTFAPEEVEILSNVSEWSRLMVDERVRDLNFAPHHNWIGHIELDRRLVAGISESRLSARRGSRSLGCSGSNP